ncbi:MAG: hydrolase [Humidesulfovibrio sp.]|nr:hydrolase [Humidesulfovibrio sp.]
MATLLIATDIFGATPEILALAKTLGAETLIVSPYGLEHMEFSDQHEAYAAFTARTSFPAYAEALRSALAASARPVDLALGFSVGATALWLCLAEEAPWLPRCAALYYGSRIRDHAELSPRRPTRLIFAEQEPGFSPEDLAARLRARGLDARLRPGSAHGFMNPRSPGFDATLYASELAELRPLFD